MAAGLSGAFPESVVLFPAGVWFEQAEMVHAARYMTFLIVRMVQFYGKVHRHGRIRQEPKWPVNSWDTDFG